MSSDSDSPIASPEPADADAPAPEFPMARRAPVRRWASWVWVLPVVALVVCGVWVSDYLVKRGFEITVRFKHGNGIKLTSTFAP